MESAIKLINVTNPFPFIPSDRNISVIPYRSGMTVSGIAAPFREILRARGYEGDIVAVRHGAVIEDMDVAVLPNDSITFFVQYGSGDTGKMIAGLALVVVAAATGAWIAGLPALSGTMSLFGSTISMGTMWGALASVAVMTLGGIMLNMVFPSGSSGDAGSPTYGWNGYYNNAKPGNVIPVAYGQCAIAAQIVNQYVTADSEYNQWIYLLLAVAQGESSESYLDSDVLIGDDTLSGFASEYSFGSTNGSLTVTDAARTALSPFAAIHHYRKMDKEKKYDSSMSSESDMTLLMHFNGAEGSTTITDDARGGPWVCRGGACITTSSPFLGMGCLKLAADVDYIDTDDLEALRLPGDFTFECRILRSSAVDNAIFSQEVTNGATGTKTRVSLVYVSGTLAFQVARGADSWWEGLASVAASVSISLNTWTHVCVQKSGSTIRLYVNGSSVGEGSGYADYPWPEDLATYEYDAIPYSSLSSTHKSAYQNRVGYGWYFSGGDWPAGGSVSISEIHGLCFLDEMRVTRGLAYAFDSFTPPAAALQNPFDADGDDTEIIDTKGSCDAVRIMIECPSGLYKTNSNGELKSYSVSFDLSYRSSGSAGSWTTSTVSLSAKARYSVRKQFDLTFPARGKYQVKVRRRTADDGENTAVSSKTYLTGLDEITNNELAYPGIRCVALGIKASDSLSGQVPAIRIIDRNNSLTVPGWPEDQQNSRSCRSGAGDGAEQTVDPTVPAWAAFDALTNDKYGRGIDPAKINRTRWEEWIDWTEEVVGSYKRAQFNGVFDGSPASLKTALNHIENVGRAKIIPLGQTYSVIIDKPETERGLFTYGKIKSGSFKVQWIPKSEKIDEIEIEYFDKSKMYESQSVYGRATWFDSLTRPARSTKVTLIGCNSKDQAQREAIFRIQKTEFTTRMVEFTVPVEAVVLEPGAVIRVQHDSNRYTYGGLLGLDVNGSTITLDRAVTLSSAVFGSGVKIWVRDQDDNIYERTITGPFDEATQTLSLSSTLTASRFDPYAIGRPNDEKWLYRITKLDVEKDELVSITALEYTDDVYYHADYDNGNTAI